MKHHIKIKTKNVVNRFKMIGNNVGIITLGVIVRSENVIEEIETKNTKVCELILKEQLTASLLTTP